MGNIFKKALGIIAIVVVALVAILYIYLLATA